MAKLAENPFQKAEKKGIKLRMGLQGPAKAGKTMTALQIAAALGGRTAFIDTEYGSALRYADLFDFDHIALTDFAPERYVEMIKAAESLGYSNIIIDSMSHAWSSETGIVQRADTIAKASKSGNTFQAWAEIKPVESAFWRAILGSSCHIICCFRTKTEYLVETNEKGKAAPRKIGTAPIQRADVEYELDIIGDLTVDNMATFIGRCPALKGKLINLTTEGGKKIMGHVIPWLGEQEASQSGELTPATPESTPTPTKATTATETPSEFEPPAYPANAIDTIEKIHGNEDILEDAKATGWMGIGQRTKTRAKHLPKKSGGAMHDDSVTLTDLHKYLKFLREEIAKLPD